MHTFFKLTSAAVLSLGLSAAAHAQSMSQADIAQALHADIPAQGNAAVVHIESELHQVLQQLEPDLAPVPYLNAQPQTVEVAQPERS